MMKQTVTAFIAIVYLLFASGFSMNIHYCMGKLDSIHLFVAASDKCGKCGMHTEDSKGCCKDETVLYKINDNHQLTQINFQFDAPFIVVKNNNFEYKNEIVFSNNTIHTFSDNSPPPLIQDRCIMFSTFRI